MATRGEWRRIALDSSCMVALTCDWHVGHVATFKAFHSDGLAGAALTSALFIPHIRAAWAGNAAYSASQYAQVFAFHLLGLTVGWLSGTQRRLTTRYRDAVTSLEHANRELKESQDHLRRADRLSALGEIAAGLAHEIQNPLAGIKGALEIVASRARPDTPTHRPSGERNWSLTTARRSAGNGTSIPAFATAPRPPGSCAKNTSAGEFAPSSNRVAAISEVLP